MKTHHHGILQITVLLLIMLLVGCGGETANPNDTNGTHDTNNTHGQKNIYPPTLSVSAKNGLSKQLTIQLTDINTSAMKTIHLYRSTADNPAEKVLIHTFAPTDTHAMTWVDNGLEGCTDYYYWAEGCSDRSGTEVCQLSATSASDKTVPNPPMNLKAFSHTIRSVSLQWQNNTDTCTVRYHIYGKSAVGDPFQRVPDHDDILDGAVGGTAVDVTENMYIHYRAVAEDDQGRLSTLSCSVAKDYPQYGASTEQDPCHAAVGYTWGDKPHFPWASINGYTDRVVFRWNDVPLLLNADSSVQQYAEAYRVRTKKNGGNWSAYQDFNYSVSSTNGQYQEAHVLGNSDETIALEVQTKYMYDGDGDGSLEIAYSDPVTITGKVAPNAGSTGGTAQLGLPPVTMTSAYYPGKITVRWTSTSGATYYKIYAMEVNSICPSDSTNPAADGYSLLVSSITDAVYDHSVRGWSKWCYRIRACNGSGCGDYGPHAYGNASSNWLNE